MLLVLFLALNAGIKVANPYVFDHYTLNMPILNNNILTLALNMPILNKHIFILRDLGDCCMAARSPALIHWKCVGSGRPVPYSGLSPSPKRTNDPKLVYTLGRMQLSAKMTNSISS